MIRMLLSVIFLLLVFTSGQGLAAEESTESTVEISDEDREIAEMIELLELLELLTEMENVTALEDNQ